LSRDYSSRLEVALTLSHDQSPCTLKEHSKYEQYVNGFSYLKGIGAGLYATQTQPDIQHAMGILVKFGANPGTAHLEAFKHLLCYLNATVHFILTLGGKNSGIDLIGWTDSDWAQDPDSQ
jgi:hypothetical protein